MAEPDSSEAERLAALHQTGLLDTGREDRFDRFTRMASAMTNAPIALISLIDRERQWFKSRVGLEAEETPRNQAFCDITIREDRTMVVNDATLDDRFSQNPLVLGDPKIRFYAGVPLKLSNGARIGSLCIIDSVPRDGLKRSERNALEDLAEVLVREIENDSGSGETEALLIRQQLILADMKHRMGNMFANISAMISLADSRETSHDVFVQELQNRILAMSHAQDRLSETSERNAAFAGLANDVMSQFGQVSGAERKITLAGSDFRATPEAAFSLALLLNELGTNSIKHGALGMAGGSVSLSWNLEDDLFRLHWQEAGVGDVSPPERQGFGSLLLHEIIPDELKSTARADYNSDGLSYFLETGAENIMVADRQD